MEEVLSSMCTTSSLQLVASPGRTRGRCHQRLHAALMARLNGKYEQLVSDRKQALFANLRGDVLEIGPGTGSNLAYLPLAIRWMGVEPNPYMHSYIQESANRLGLKVDVRLGNAERLPAEDSSVDAVVGTLVLCSVLNPAVALREILRVLKPGGRFLFIEHVAAPRGSGLRRLQRWIRPMFKLVADGCHLDRETSAAIEGAGFSEVKVERFAIPASLRKPHIMGIATK
jgi:SAM-dependent methyltransferase